MQIELKKYYQEIDFCKCIAISLVVFGHILSWTQNTQLERIILIVIYSFHMPLFFMLSGVNFHAQCTLREFVNKKAKTLLIPAVLFPIYNALAYRVYILLFYPEKISEYLKVQIDGETLYHTVGMTCKSANSAYWFLPVLFSCELIYFFLLKSNIWIIRNVCFLGGILISMILYQKGIVLPLGIEEALLALPFLDLGYCIKDEKLKWSKIAMMFGIYLIGIISWLKEGYTIVDFYNSNISDILLFYLMGTSATLGIIMAVRNTHIMKTKIICWIGKRSLYIYGFHYSLLPFWKEIDSKIVISNIMLKILWDLLGMAIIIGICIALMLIIRQLYILGKSIFALKR